MPKPTPALIADRSAADLPPTPRLRRDGPPAAIDQEADVEIPRRALSAWTPAGGLRMLRRPLTEAERRAVLCRHDELAVALTPAARDERDRVDAAIGTMLGGFRAMRQQGEDVAAVVAVTRYVLAEFPAWAIEEGCRRVMLGRAGLDARYAPNDVELHAIVAGVCAPYRRQLDAAQRLLAAPIDEEA